MGEGRMVTFYVRNIKYTKKTIRWPSVPTSTQKSNITGVNSQEKFKLEKSHSFDCLIKEAFDILNKSTIQLWVRIF